jgi:hypothetical protein
LKLFIHITLVWCLLFPQISKSQSGIDSLLIIEVPLSYYFNDANANYVGGTAVNATLTGNTVVITFLEGPTQSFTMPNDGSPLVIRDENGNQFIIGANGQVQQSVYYTFSNDKLDNSATKDFQVQFSNDSIQHPFGFDRMSIPQWYKDYEIIQLSDKTAYKVPYISISISAPLQAKVKASFKTTGTIHPVITFSTSAGVNIPATRIGTTDNYNLSFSYSSLNTAIYAKADGKKIGKLNIIALDQKNSKVIIVPVNNASISSSSSSTLQASLNDIYQQANSKWTVTLKPNFTIAFDSNSNGLDVSDATLMSKYSSEMKAIRDAYKIANPTYDKTAYYLFVVPSFSDPAQQGYMVRGKGIGFVTSAANIKTIAHELAHGAFGLEHTFGGDNNIPQNSTDNLLDYGTGKQLSKKQWEKVHSVLPTISWFDDEEDGSSSLLTAADRINVYEFIQNVKIAVGANASLPIGKLPNRTYGYRLKNVQIAGIQYDYILLYQDVYSNPSKKTISPKNKISSEEKIGMNVGTGVSTPYGLIKIDDAVYIEVPANRRLLLEAHLKTSPQNGNMILFVNGYRNALTEIQTFREFPNSMNKVHNGDIYGYWSGLDLQFLQRIGSKNAMYADGHHSIITSNHLTQVIFTGSMASSLHGIINPLASATLSTVPNPAGFATRQSYGKVAAQDFVTKMNAGTIKFNKNTDTLDVVAHSMGFAYAQGMIETLRQAGVKIKRYYIIAPENGCTGTIDFNSFDEVWQYGTDEANTPLTKQDGVAPQCKVGGLDNNNRAYIPDNGTVPRGFLASHMIANYGWIFSKLTINDNGYVKARK